MAASFNQARGAVIRVCAALLCALSILSWAGSALAQDANDARQPLKVEVLEQGTSSRRVRSKAIDDLPWEGLSDSANVQVRQVLDRLSLYRRLPVVACETDPRVLKFFTDHPDVAVSIWRAMGVSKLQMWQTDRTEYECDLGDGTIGILNLLYSDEQRMLVICDGKFRGPGLSSPIEARCLMHLRTEFRTGKAGKPVAHHTADVFVEFPSATVEAVAKVVSPLSNRIADRNFEEVSLFVHMMWVAMTRQPGWVEQIAARLDGVLPESRQRLLQLAGDVYAEAR